MHRLVENFQIWVSNCVPRWLAYWCTIRVGIHATTGEFSDQTVSEVTLSEILKRW